MLNGLYLAVDQFHGVDLSRCYQGSLIRESDLFPEASLHPRVLGIVKWGSDDLTTACKPSSKPNPAFSSSRLSFHQLIIIHILIISSVTMAACIFCRIIKGEIPALKVVAHHDHRTPASVDPFRVSMKNWMS